MRNVALSTAVICCLFAAMWQLATKATNKPTEKTAAKIAVENKSGFQCPALYGVPGAAMDQDFPGTIKHCKCEIGAMLEQRDGSFRCSYCGKTENE
jgi:hypothetical protein